MLLRGRRTAHAEIVNDVVVAAGEETHDGRRAVEVEPRISDRCSGKYTSARSVKILLCYLKLKPILTLMASRTDFTVFA